MSQRLFLGLQSRDKAAKLVDKTIKILFQNLQRRNI